MANQDVEVRYRITTQGKQDAKDLAAAQREIRTEHEKSAPALRQAATAAEATVSSMQRLGEAERAAAQSSLTQAQALDNAAASTRKALDALNNANSLEGLKAVSQHLAAARRELEQMAQVKVAPISVPVNAAKQTAQLGGSALASGATGELHANTPEQQRLQSVRQLHTGYTQLSSTIQDTQQRELQGTMNLIQANQVLLQTLTMQQQASMQNLQVTERTLQTDRQRVQSKTNSTVEIAGQRINAAAAAAKSTEAFRPVEDIAREIATVHQDAFDQSAKAGETAAQRVQTAWQAVYREGMTWRDFIKENIQSAMSQFGAPQNTFAPMGAQWRKLTNTEPGAIPPEIGGGAGEASPKNQQLLAELQNIEQAQAAIEEAIKRTEAADMTAAAMIERDHERLREVFKGDAVALAQIEAAMNRLKSTEAKSRGLDERKRQLAEIEEATKRVNAMVERAAEAEMSGVERVRAARKKALDELGKTPELRKKLNDLFDKDQAQEFSQIGNLLQNQLSQPFISGQQAALQFAASLGPVGIGLGLVASAITAAAAASWNLVESQAGIAEGYGNIALRTDLTTEELEQLAAAAKAADTDITILETSARILASALDDPAGAGKKAAAALREAGISIYDFDGNARALGPVLKEVLMYLSSIEDTGKRVAIAQLLLGRASRELLPLISNYEELNKKVKSLGVGGNPELNKMLNSADDQLDELGIKWQEFKKNLAVKIAPITIEYMFKPVNRMLDPNRPDVSGLFPGVGGWANVAASFVEMPHEKRDREHKANLERLNKEIAETQALLDKKAKLENAASVVGSPDKYKAGIEELNARLKTRRSIDEAKAALDAANKAASEPEKVKDRVTELESQADKDISVKGKQLSDSFRARWSNSIEGIQSEIDTLTERIKKAELSLLDPSSANAPKRAELEQQYNADKAQKKALEERQKDLQDYDNKRKQIAKDIEQHEFAVAEQTLSNLEKIRAKHGQWIEDLRREKATRAELARAAAILPEEIALEERKQALEIARNELALAEARAQISFAPREEYAQIEAVYELRVRFNELLLTADERTKANQQAELNRAKALLDLFRQQVETRHQLSQEFAIEAESAVSQVVTKSIETSASPERFRTSEDELGQARAVAEEKERLIRQEYEVRRAHATKEADLLDAERQRDLALLRNRADLIGRQQEIESRRGQQLAQLKAETVRTEMERVTQLETLKADPLDEEAAIQRIHALKIQFADAEMARTGDLFEYKRRMDEAEFDRVRRMMELRNKQLEEFRDGVGRLVDELESNGGEGVENFLRSMIGQIRKTIIQNLATMAFEGIRDRLPKIGGQTREETDPVTGETRTVKTTLGKILTGTPFEEKTDTQIALKDATVLAAERMQNLARTVEEQTRAYRESKSELRSPEQVAGILGTDTTGEDARRRADRAAQETLERIRQTPEAQSGQIDPEQLAAEAKLISSAVVPAVESTDANTTATESNTAALEALLAVLQAQAAIAPIDATEAAQTPTEGIQAAVSAAVSASAPKDDPRAGATGALVKASTSLQGIAGVIARFVPQLAPIAAGIGVLTTVGASQAPATTPPILPSGVATRAGRELTPEIDLDIPRGGPGPYDTRQRSQALGDSVASGLFSGDSTTSQRITSGIATGAVVAGGVMGVKSGIEQGGAKGYTKAASSALATAAALDPEPISKAILAAGAAITGLASSLLGDKRADRLEEIDNDIDEARQKASPYNLPGMEIVVDSRTGSEVSYDKRGNLRVHEGSKPRMEAFDRLTGFDEEGNPEYTSSRRLTYTGATPFAPKTDLSKPPEKSFWEKFWDVGKWALTPYVVGRAIGGMWGTNEQDKTTPSVQPGTPVPDSPRTQDSFANEPASQLLRETNERMSEQTAMILSAARDSFASDRKFADSMERIEKVYRSSFEMRGLEPVGNDGAAQGQSIQPILEALPLVLDRVVSDALVRDGRHQSRATNQSEYVRDFPLEAYDRLGFSPRESKPQQMDAPKAAPVVYLTQQVTLPVSAMDSQDILRRRDTIADALKQALGGMHSVREDIRSLVNPR